MSINYTINKYSISTPGVYQLPTTPDPESKAVNGIPVVTMASLVRAVLDSNHIHAEEYNIQYKVNGEEASAATVVNPGNFVSLTLVKKVSKEDALFQKFSSVYSARSHYKLTDASVLTDQEKTINTVLDGTRPLGELSCLRDEADIYIRALERIEGIEAVRLPSLNDRSRDISLLVFRADSKNLAIEFVDFRSANLDRWKADIDSGDTRVKTMQRILSTYQRYGRFFHYTEESIIGFGKKLAERLEKEKALAGPSPTAGPAPSAAASRDVA